MRASSLAACLHYLCSELVRTVAAVTSGISICYQMGIDENILNLFTTRMRQMVIQYEKLKTENAELRARLNEVDGELTKARDDYSRLMMAKMLEVSDGDMLSVQKRLAKLIRDVNKCVTLLSE